MQCLMAVSKTDSVMYSSRAHIYPFIRNSYVCENTIKRLLECPPCVGKPISPSVTDPQKAREDLFTKCTGSL